MIRELLMAGAISLGLVVPAAADIEQWNLTASRPSFPTIQNMSGFFYYDTSAGQISNWDILVNGQLPSNTNFIPVPSYTLQPCGSAACNVNIYSPYNPSLSSAEVIFSDNRNTADLTSVSLGLPLSVSLAATGPQVINLVGGYPYSIAASQNESGGYDEFDVSGTLTYAGSVLNNFQGGTPSNPASLANASITGLIGTINASIGGTFGNSDFYSFYTLGSDVASATITGAAAGSSFTFELLNPLTNNVVATSVLSSTDNFMASLTIPGGGDWAIGVLDAPDGTPSLAITFGTPVLGSAPVSEPNSLAIIAVGALGLCFARRTSARLERGC